MEVRVVGPLEVVGTCGVLALAPKERVVVARLALGLGAAVDDRALHDALWPDTPPPTAVKTTAGYVHRLRRTLGAEVIVRRPLGYALDAAYVRVDVATIDEAVAAARGSVARGDVTGATLEYRRAAGMFRGAAYDELDGVDAAIAEQVRLHELRLCVDEELHDLLIADGEDATLIPVLEALVTREPTRERAWGQLMTAYARSGRQADALTAYARARRVLAVDIGIEPGPQLQLLHRRLLEHDDHLFLPPRRIGHAPATGGLIGRDADVRTVLGALAGSRLVSLVGTGGTGKTRLARHLLGVIGSGAVVELAPVAADGIGSALLHSVGLVEQPDRSVIEVFARWCGDREQLIVVDNCEHVVEAAAALAIDLVQACPRLRVLATSRARLRVSGEQVIDVGPLRTPRTAAEIDSSPAVEMLVARAAQAGVHLDMTHARERIAVTELCCRLDGLPLALELAAAQLRGRSVVELCDDLGTLDLSVGARDAPRRQRSLDDLVAWSEALVPAAAAAALRRLSVFPDDFDNDAARAVIGGHPVEPGGEQAALSALVDASLVVVERRPGSAYRYHLLDTIRRHASRRLDEHGERRSTMDALLDWALAVVADIEPEIRTPRQDTAMAAAARDRLSVAAAAAHAVTIGDLCAALRLVATVPTVGPVERRALLAHLVDSTPAAPAELRARAWLALANLASDVGEGQHQADAATRALDAATEVGDDFQAAWARYFVVLGRWDDGRVVGLADLVAETTAAFRSIGSAHGVASMTWIGSQLEDDVDVAATLAAAAVDEFRALGVSSGLAHALEGQALVALRAGALELVVASLAEAVAIVSAAGNVGCTAHCVESVAAFAARRGLLGDARRLAAAAQVLRAASGHGMRVWEREGHRQVVDALGDVDVGVALPADLSVLEVAELAQAVLEAATD